MKLEIFLIKLTDTPNQLVGDNLITDDDDVVAIISREMCDYDEMFKSRMVTELREQP